MVDQRVPGTVEVTPAQVEAAKALVRWRGAKGRAVDGSIRAIARAGVPHPGPDTAAARVEATAQLTAYAMEAIAHLARLRQELGNGDPEVDKRLDEITSAAAEMIQETLVRRLDDSSGA